MRKIALLLALVLFVLPVTANASTHPRSITIIPTLGFKGETAQCSVTVMANSYNDNVIAVIKLWDGGFCIATWTATGSGYLNMNRTVEVNKGTEYIMTVAVTINGVQQDTVSTYGTC